MEGIAWDDLELLERLRSATRECSFDFERVAAVLSAGLPIRLTAEECRERFAQDFAQSAPLEQSEQSELGNQKQALVQEEKHSQESRSEVEEDESVQDVMRRLEEQEEAHLRRKEEIFERVLHSLGGIEMLGHIDPSAMRELNDVQLAFQDAQESRLLEKKKREQRLLDAAEREELSRQRTALQRRFDEGSADAQGLAWEPSSPLQQDDEAQTHHPAFRIEELFESEEFDAMLTAIEADLNSAAGEKAEDEASELADVLRFLDENAARKKNETTSKRTNPAAIKPSVAKVEQAPKTQTSGADESKPHVAQQASHPLKVAASAPRAPARTREARSLPDEDDDEEGEDEESWSRNRAFIKSRAAAAPLTQTTSPARVTRVPIVEEDTVADEDDYQSPLAAVEAASAQSLIAAAMPPAAAFTEASAIAPAKAEQLSTVAVVAAVAGGSLASSVRKEREKRGGIMQGARGLVRKEELPKATNQEPIPVVSEYVQDEPSVPPPPPEPKLEALDDDRDGMLPFAALPSTPLPSSSFMLQGRISTTNELMLCLFGYSKSHLDLISVNYTNGVITFVLDGDATGLDASIAHLRRTSVALKELMRKSVGPLPALSCMGQTFSFAVHGYVTSRKFGEVFDSLLRRCEECGLTLVGVQTFYVPKPDLLSPNHRRQLPADLIKSSRSEEAHLVVLALHGSQIDAIDVHASELFRDLLGPDDPFLAKQTDPLSMRAIYGESRERNIGLSIPVTTRNIGKDLRSWFGVDHSALPASADSGATLLSPVLRKHTAVFTFPVIDDPDSSRLHKSQIAVVDLVRRVLTLGLCLSVDTELLSSSQAIDTVCGFAGLSSSVALVLVVQFTSTAVDAGVRKLESHLVVGIDVIRNDSKFWPVDVIFKLDQPKLELLHPLEASDLKPEPSHLSSHFAIGIPDVFVVVMTSSKEQKQPLSILLQQREFFTHELLHSFPPGLGVTVVALGETCPGEYAACLRSMNGYELAGELTASVNDKLIAKCTRGKQDVMFTVRAMKGRSASDYIYTHFFSRGRCFTSLALREAMDVVPRLPASMGGLFPPTEFKSCGFVFIRLPLGSRVLSRVLKRLEREFDIISVEIASLDGNALTALAKDSIIGYGLEKRENFSVPAGEPVLFFVVLIRGSTSLGTLKSLVGPPQLVAAEAAYPKSLVSILGCCSSSAFDLFATITVPSAELACRSIFGHEVDKFLNAKGLHAAGEDDIDNTAVIEYVGERIPHETILLQNPCRPTASGVTNDIAALVITSPLIAELGLAIILDALIRENFVVRNLHTRCFSEGLAKRFLEAAGQSSLSMKPSIETITRGPCLVIAIEGLSGSLSRIQSFTTAPGSREPLCKLRSGEYGVLGSSSLMIAKGLLRLGFE